jgi:hypothetical protein
MGAHRKMYWSHDVNLPSQFLHGPLEFYYLTTNEEVAGSNPVIRFRLGVAQW